MNTEILVQVKSATGGATWDVIVDDPCNTARHWYRRDEGMSLPTRSLAEAEAEDIIRRIQRAGRRHTYRIVPIQ